MFSQQTPRDCQALTSQVKDASYPHEAPPGLSLSPSPPSHPPADNSPPDTLGAPVVTSLLPHLHPPTHEAPAWNAFLPTPLPSQVDSSASSRQGPFPSPGSCPQAPSSGLQQYSGLGAHPRACLTESVSRPILPLGCVLQESRIRFGGAVSLPSPFLFHLCAHLLYLLSSHSSDI